VGGGNSRNSESSLGMAAMAREYSPHIGFQGSWLLSLLSLWPQAEIISFDRDGLMGNAHPQLRMASICDFRFCPLCGSKEFGQRGPTVFVCGQCDYHHHLNPVVAVAAFLPDPSGRILMIRRGSEPSKGKLGAPGGFVDIGETAEAALHREIKEEVNLEVVSLEYLCSHPNEYPYRGRIVQVLDFFYIGQVRAWDDAAALDEVEGLVFRDPRQIDPAEVAFVSLAKALKNYVMHGA
jgi:NAD+ diphosphatase